MSILQTTELKKYYGAEPNITKALDGVTLSIERGEFVAIIGTSGSGKSTLLNMMGGLDVPTSGQVIVDGKELSTLNDEALTIFRRRKIGFIFQNYNLVPVLNVFENIVLPVELDGDKVDKKFMDEVVRMLALEDNLFANPGVCTIFGKEITADRYLILLLGQAAFQKLHLVTGNIHRFLITINIGGVVSLLRRFHSQHIILSYP